MTRYFVWVDGICGPQPQIWNEKYKFANLKPIKTLIEPIALSDDDTRNLDKLSAAYPFEAKL